MVNEGMGRRTYAHDGPNQELCGNCGKLCLMKMQRKYKYLKKDEWDEHEKIINKRKSIIFGSRSFLSRDRRLPYDTL